MRPKARLTGLAFALLSIASTCLARETPRVHVEGIAATIEQYYFDEERSRQIASELRTAAARGEFDALQDKRELASALTVRLAKSDTHFRVGWAAPAAAPVAAGPSPGPSHDAQRRGNYGVRRLELLPGNLGYLDLRGFAGFEFGAPQQPARKAIDTALQVLAGADALIIDLRDNGGGAPQMVGYLCSAFVAKDADIFNTFRGRGRTMSEAPLEWHPQPRLETPLFILTSGRTASAAESFAYTLKNAKRATIVGETSMGAANPGADVEAGHGFTVFVSFATPVNPISKDNWEGHGVKPDVVVAPNAALDTARRLALETLLAKAAPSPETTDTRWALDALLVQTATPPPIRAADYVGSYGPLAVAEQQGQLTLIQGRRPPRTLLALARDRFTVADNPSQRVEFARDAAGQVIALESRFSDGDSARHRRVP